MQTMNDFRIGQYVVYHNESTDHYELGRIKSLHPLVNAYCIKETLLGGDYFENMYVKEGAAG